MKIEVKNNMLVLKIKELPDIKTANIGAGVYETEPLEHNGITFFVIPSEGYIGCTKESWEKAGATITE